MISANYNTPAFKGLYTVRSKHAKEARGKLFNVQKEAKTTDGQFTTFICNDSEDTVNSNNLLVAKIPAFYLLTDEGIGFTKPQLNYARKLIPEECWGQLWLSSREKPSFKGYFRVANEDAPAAKEHLQGRERETPYPKFNGVGFYCRGRRDEGKYDFDNRKRLFEAGIPCAYKPYGIRAREIDAKKLEEDKEKVRKRQEQKEP